MRLRLFARCIVLTFLAFAATTQAQSTAFTYQGRLKNGTAAANGLHDLRFRLWDAASGGSQLGSTLCVDNVLVSEGLFTATIDFGQQFATTGQRFLEIEARAESGLDCSNAAGFIVMAPRQLLSSSPFASFAKLSAAAATLTGPAGSPANAVFVDNSGRVGIGTTAPTHSLHIANPAPTLAIQDTDSTSQQVGYISYRDSGNVERAWVGYGTAGSQVFSIVNARSSGHIALLPFSGGNVGIGTTAPGALLDVRGDIRLGSSGQYFSPAGEENLRIIRGTFSSVGTVIRGSGFTVQRVDVAKYHVTFTVPFAATPTVTATALRGVEAKFVSIDDTIPISNSQVGFVSYSTFQNSFADSQIDFIAVGPR